jgi:hypothetical protein
MPVLMRRHVAIVTTSAILLLFCSTGIAQDRDRAQAILERYVEAVGGVQAVEAIRTRVTLYEMDLGWRIRGELEVRQQAPDRVVERGNASGWGWHGTFNKGFDGTVGWAKAPEGRLHRLEGNALQTYVLRSRLDRDAHLEDVYPLRVALPDRTINGKRQAVVELITQFGTREVWYFDRATGLLTRTDVSDSGNPESQAPETTTFDDYRLIDRLLIPFHLTIHDGKRRYSLTVKTVRNNVTLSRDDFVVPHMEER